MCVCVWFSVANLVSKGWFKKTLVWSQCKDESLWRWRGNRVWLVSCSNPCELKSVQYIWMGGLIQVVCYSQLVKRFCFRNSFFLFYCMQVHILSVVEFKSTVRVFCSTIESYCDMYRDHRRMKCDKCWKLKDCTGRFAR